MNGKVDKYFKLLYPEYETEQETLSTEEKRNAMQDKLYIEKNIDVIDIRFRKYVFHEEYAGRQVDEQEVIQEVFIEVRTEYYFKLLHPEYGTEYETLSLREKRNAIQDSLYIEKNIDVIHRRFEEYVFQEGNAGRQVDEKEIMKNIISELRAKQITTQKIGEATINTSTTVKKEVEQVENYESTRGNNIKEGEEVKDDN